MTEPRLTVTINLPFSTIATLVLLLHAFALIFHLQSGRKPWEEIAEYHKDQPIKIVDFPHIRTVGVKNSKIKDRTLFSKNVAKKPVADPFTANSDLARPSPIPRQQQKPQIAQPQQQKQVAQKNPYRPDIRPKALDQLMARQEPVQQVAARTSSGGAAALAGSPTLTKSLMNMQVEVPEGVKMDELNDFELQFYSFQQRMMEKYVNAITLNVRDYERRFSMPVLIPEGRHIMTGRVTFDSDGNIKQIKMIRWSQAEKLQSMFEEILKSMVTLPNPPKVLRNKEGEFVVFYTFTVNNG